MTLPELLFEKAELRFDEQRARQQLAFAFASGGIGEALDEVLQTASVSGSTFDESCFASDLYLGDLVKLLARWHRSTPQGVRLNAKKLAKLMSQPVSASVARKRHQVLAELLAEPDLRQRLTDLWIALAALKELLESADLGKRPSAIARRVSILRKLRAAIDQLENFSHSATSLANLHLFGQQIKRSPGYRDLCSVLDHESARAAIDLRITLAYDGTIRRLAVVHVDEPKRAAFVPGLLSRWLLGLLSLLRGYRLREEEILGRTIQAVYDALEPEVLWLLQLYGDIEFYLAALAFRDRATKAGLPVCLPTGSASSSQLSLSDLFNPFLLEEATPPIPCDIHLERPSIVVVTGPNSGGKTRLLQALALCQLFAQNGFFVPASRAEVPWLSGLFVSLVHAQSSDQHEGRLGTELIRIRRMFELLTPNSLITLDELCSGTNPSEGEEIFELVVTLLVQLGPLAVITTHFLEFAQRLEREKSLDLKFLRVELDDELAPTYRFVPGVATTSLARKTAERLGVTRQALQELIEQKQRKLTTG